MAYVNLTNTSGQVDVSLRCSYDRLIKNFAGPLTENASSTATCGFLIQDGNKNTGIFVANSGIVICKDRIEIKCDANALLTLMPTRCFIVSGNGSLHSFSNNGTVSFGSGICTAYGNGIQSFQPSPTLVLKDTESSNTHAIKFLDITGNESFAICQSNTFTCIPATGNFIFKSSGQENSFHISGSNISISGSPNRNYSFVNYQNSFFSGVSYFRTDFHLSGTGYIANFGNGTGLCVLSKSAFFNDVLVSGGDLRICNKNLFTNCCVTGSCAFFNNACFYTCANTACVCTQGLYLSGDVAHLSGDVCFYRTNCSTGISRLNQINFQSSTGINLNLTGGNLNLSGNLTITGGLNICSPTHLGADHFIRGKSISVISTGAGNVNSFFGNSIFTGDLTTTCCVSASILCSTGTASNNCICGTLRVQNDICSTTSICASNIIASSNICSLKSISGDFISGNNFIQTKGDAVSCFCSSGLSVGLTQTGYVGAINTSKAWGIIKMTDGVPNLCCGWNLSSTRVYSNNNTCVFAMGICFSTPIKYPFIVNFNVYGNNTNPLMCAAPVANTYITGHATPLTSLVGGGLAASSPHTVELYISGRCSATSNIATYSANSTYSEIFYNFQVACKGAATCYSELLKTNFDAVVHFNILGI